MKTNVLPWVLCGLLAVVVLTLTAYLLASRRTASINSRPQPEGRGGGGSSCSAQVAELREQVMALQVRGGTREGTAAVSSGALKVAVDQNVSDGLPGVYPQVGYLVPRGEASGGGDPLLALYGRPSVARRSRWYYYVIAPGGIKVPVVRNGRDCMEEVGCDELYDGEEVTVPDASIGAQPWTARLYKPGVTRI